MPMNVIMPALELAQELGKVQRFAEGTGRSRRQGQSSVEIETDKVTAEIETPAAALLGEISAREGDQWNN